MTLMALTGIALSAPGAVAVAQEGDRSQPPVRSIADNETVIEAVVKPITDLGRTIQAELADIASTPAQERQARRRRQARREAVVARREAVKHEAALADLGVSLDTLEAIAACESGGDPAIVSSDGTYRGKYQFSFETWASVGGSGDPAAAAESEQDYRAALLYSQAGSSPWPVCGV